MSDLRQSLIGLIDAAAGPDLMTLVTDWTIGVVRSPKQR